MWLSVGMSGNPRLTSNSWSALAFSCIFWRSSVLVLRCFTLAKAAAQTGGGMDVVKMNPGAVLRMASQKALLPATSEVKLVSKKGYFSGAQAIFDGPKDSPHTRDIL
jgi:hypothetical protein